MYEYIDPIAEFGHDREINDQQVLLDQTIVVAHSISDLQFVVQKLNVQARVRSKIS
jgi:hypothetical protein